MNDGATIRIGWAIALLVLADSSGWAQPPRQQVRENVNCQGIIKGLGRGLMQVEGEGGEQWLVAVPVRPQDISFQATASAGFLRAGMLVQFNTILDRKGEIQSPVTTVKVVSPREGVELGLRSEGGLEGKELFKSDAAPSERKSSAERLPYSVTGSIRAIRERRFQVHAGGAMVQGELADGCTISVDISDYTAARIGDAVELSGWHHAELPNQIQAMKLTIVAEHPLESPEEARKRRAASRNSTKRSAGTVKSAK